MSIYTQVSELYIEASKAYFNPALQHDCETLEQLEQLKGSHPETYATVVQDLDSEWVEANGY